ncbi:hypothetical protein COOONC_12415 [Cooperia oncophora]
MDSHSAGLGGGHFMTIYNATTQQCTVIDAREVAPKAATEDMYRNRWNDSRTGWRAVAVPGELHGLWTEFEKYGSKKSFLERSHSANNRTARRRISNIARFGKSVGAKS